MVRSGRIGFHSKRNCLCPNAVSKKTIVSPAPPRRYPAPQSIFQIGDKPAGEKRSSVGPSLNQEVQVAIRPGFTAHK